MKLALCGGPYHAIGSCRVCGTMYMRQWRERHRRKRSYGFKGPECLVCEGTRSTVKESGYTDDGQRIRRRVCQDCGHDAASVEVYIDPTVTTFWKLNPARAIRKREGDYARRGKGIYRLPNRRVEPDRVAVSIFVTTGGKQPTTHCRRGHELTPDNIYNPPGTSERNCVTCRKARHRERRAA